MKQKLMLLLLLLPAALLAQNNPGRADAAKYNIGFNKTKDTLVNRRSDEERTVNVEITSSNTSLEKFKDCKLYVSVDEDKSTLPRADYEIFEKIEGKNIKDLKDKGNFVRLFIKKDNADDKQVKDLKLVIKLVIKKTVGEKEEEDKDNESETTEITLIIKPADQPLDNYRYLGYLGTNFDMVDGVQANKLYFALNILIPETKKYGISVGVYGNRTMTQTDTSTNTTFTSRIEAYGRDSVIYFRDTAIKMTSRISDNIGAFFSPIIPIPWLTDDKLKVYYAPNFEFIWRRSKIESKFTNNNTYKKDTASNRYPAGVALPLVTPLSTKVNQNIYDAYLGLLGILFRFETDEISIRLSGALGINLNYMPVGGLSSTSVVYKRNTNAYFQGRLFITEPTTGFTLGAEVSNLFGKNDKLSGYSNAQPYYNVTLSKAFNLKNLAAIVKPLSNR
ncbi:hypothetical protein [Ferruginibacter profundus]